MKKLSKLSFSADDDPDAHNAGTHCADFQGNIL